MKLTQTEANVTLQLVNMMRDKTLEALPQLEDVHTKEVAYAHLSIMNSVMLKLEEELRRPQ